MDIKTKKKETYTFIFQSHIHILCKVTGTNVTNMYMWILYSHKLQHEYYSEYEAHWKYPVDYYSNHCYLNG